MNAIHVVLAGVKPMLHNRCWSDGSGRRPTTDLEQAEGRLFRDGRGLYLPWWVPSIAIGRAAWSRDRACGARWPRDIRHAAEAAGSLRAAGVAFEGEWEPQVFARDGLPPVALPRFDAWRASFTLEYDPAFYDAETLRGLLEHSGRHVGLPQFAPFAGKGPWGRFEVAKWEPARVGRGEEQAA